MRYQQQKSGVIDTRTTLVWMDTKQSLTYHEALEHADRVSQETGLPWRVPTLDELLTLIDWTRVGPATSFPGMESSTVWTATLYRGTEDVWYLDTHTGVVGYTYPNESNATFLVR